MDTSKLMFRDGLMKDERILVTGGGTGLGKEMAEGLLKLGAEVHICGRRGEVCEATAKELVDRHGGKVVPHGCDIAKVGRKKSGVRKRHENWLLR